MNNKILVAVIVILLVIIGVVVSNKEKRIVSDNNPNYPSPGNPYPDNDRHPDGPCPMCTEGSIECEYAIRACEYPVKYDTFQNALKVFKSSTHPNMEVTAIVFSVPGKIPREDGDPYFIGRGIINESANECIVGYMNLITGVSNSHRDVCVIYN